MMEPNKKIIFVPKRTDDRLQEGWPFISLKTLIEGLKEDGDYPFQTH